MGFTKGGGTKSGRAGFESIETKQISKVSPMVERKKVQVTYINHATFLLQLDGLTIITDPIFSKRCSPVSFAGPKRVHPPGMKIEDLPKIDAVIISHDHYDHLDLDSLDIIIKRDQPRVFVGLGVGNRIDNYDNIREFDWWEDEEFKDSKISFVPVQHFSGRGLTDTYTTLWGGFVIEVDGKKIYFGGDSGYADHYTQTYEKFGPYGLIVYPYWCLRS